MLQTATGRPPRVGAGYLHHLRPASHVTIPHPDLPLYLDTPHRRRGRGPAEGQLVAVLLGLQDHVVAWSRGHEVTWSRGHEVTWSGGHE